MAGDRLSSTLSAIARTHRLDADRLQYLHGEPSEVLPGVVVRRDYDLVVMGKPRNGGQPDPARSVAARVVKASAGDVLFAPPVAGRSGVVVRGRAAAGLSGDSRGRRQREL
jgi:nucleotide-binding universal stress UspA family protein